MRPQRSLLTRRSYYSSLNGQFNRRSEASCQVDSGNGEPDTKIDLDKTDPSYYNLKLVMVEPKKCKSS